MTKKIFRISSMTLGLSLLLLGNGMNQAKAVFTIQWPNNNFFNSSSYVAYFLPLYNTESHKTQIATGSTEAGDTSSYNVRMDKTWLDKTWSSYPKGAIYIQVYSIGTKILYYRFTTDKWSNTGSNSIEDVLNNTTITLNSNGTYTITYPN